MAITHSQASQCFQLLAANIHARTIAGDVRCVEQYRDDADSILAQAGFYDMAWTITGTEIRCEARDMNDMGRGHSFIFDRKDIDLAKTDAEQASLTLKGTAVTIAHRMAAIRRFMNDATPDADSGWIGHCVDSLQTSIGIIDGANVARACGYTV